MGSISVKSYDLPDVDTREVLRYAGAAQAAPEVLALMEDCLREARDKIKCRVCWQRFPVRMSGETTDLSFARTTSKNLQKNLTDCDSIVLFAATVGLEIDRLIARYNRVSPARALMFQAIGAERIEALCRCFNDEISRQEKEAGGFTRPRFSPGYGDLPLELQKDIFRVLDCPRKIGLTLNESLLMSPSKSVTALIGIGRGAGECTRDDGCADCGKTNCVFRRTI